MATNGSVMESFSLLVDKSSPEVENFSSSDGYLEAAAQTKCSKAKPVTVDILPKLVLNKDKLKKHCRSGVHPSARKRLWLDVVGVQDHDSVLLVRTLGEPREEVDGRDSLGSDLCSINTYHTRQDSYLPGVQRVLLAVARRLGHEMTPSTSSIDTDIHAPRTDTDIHAPLMVILTQVMLHFLEEWQVFALLHHLMTRSAWLDQSHTHYAASHLTLISLIHTRAPSTLEAVCRLKPSAMTQQAFLDKITRHWYLWPFYQQPFWFTVRIVDLYIIEGPKIFYRLALSGLKLFAALSQKLDGVSLVTAVQDVLCNLSSSQRSRWLQDAFNISHLSWLHILHKWQAHVVACGGSSQHAGADSIDGRGVESDSSQDGEVGGDRTLSDHASSELLPGAEDWEMLWKWLPEWVTSREPRCLFNASIHGYNLRTLYRKCENEPFILLLKSSSGGVFGGFVASPLIERHGKQFFGTGESFLFTLYPQMQGYQWTATTDLILRANDQEFIIGAGGGVFGLWLDSDLNQGSSATCLAYSNPPLCTVDAKGQFYCVGVEAYSCS